MKSRVYFVMLMVGCLFFVANVTNAQQMKPAEDRAKALTDKMKEKLTLDDGQYTKVYDVNLKYAKMTDELMASSADKAAKTDKLKAQFEAKDKELKGILTSDQYKKYDSIKQELKKEFEEKQQAKK